MNTIFTRLFAAVAVLGAANAQTECSAHPECHALGLVDDCCPTTLSGIFLDCCETPDTTCDTNAGCAGLEGECCPAADGNFLYCCFDEDPEGGGYKYASTFWGTTQGPTTGEYWVSTGDGSTKGKWFQYVRNQELVYDLLYFKGSFPDANAYVTGDKKFSIVIDSDRTTAPRCTQMILQLERVAFPTSEARQGGGAIFEPYPIGRHSRYLATVNAGGGRIEFELLDRPDENVLDSEVNAAVLLFSPGVKSGDTFTFRNLDSYTKCSSVGDGCEASPIKACPALYVEVEQSSTNTSRALQHDCSDCEDPSCVGVGQCAVDDNYSFLQEDADFAAVGENSNGTTPTVVEPDDETPEEVSGLGEAAPEQAANNEVVSSGNHRAMTFLGLAAVGATSLLFA